MMTAGTKKKSFGTRILPKWLTRFEGNVDVCLYV